VNAASRTAYTAWNAASSSNGGDDPGGISRMNFPGCTRFLNHCTIRADAASVYAPKSTPSNHPACSATPRRSSSPQRRGSLGGQLSAAASSTSNVSAVASSIASSADPDSTVRGARPRARPGRLHVRARLHLEGAARQARLSVSSKLKLDGRSAGFLTREVPAGRVPHAAHAAAVPTA
jgi:hypothetical protein